MNCPHCTWTADHLHHGTTTPAHGPDCPCPSCGSLNLLVDAGAIERLRLEDGTWAVRRLCDDFTAQILVQDLVARRERAAAMS
jgi:hypothetical protein